jgi:Zn-finger nucleic acid-binding protein
MECPVCLKTMEAQELFNIETNLCHLCGGVWLDAGELADYIKQGNIPNKLLANYCIDDSFKKVEEGNRECPRCNNMLQLLSHRGINVDFCYRCRGVWFDKGELKTLLLSYYNEVDEDTRQRRKQNFQGVQTIKSESGDENEDIIKFFDEEIFGDIEVQEKKTDTASAKPGEFCIEKELLGDADKNVIAQALPRQLKEKKSPAYSLSGLSAASFDTNTGAGMMGGMWGSKRRDVVSDAIFDFVWTLFTDR